MERFFGKNAIATDALSEFQRRFGAGPAVLAAAAFAFSAVMGVAVAESGSSLLSQTRDAELVLREKMARNAESTSRAESGFAAAGSLKLQDRLEFNQASVRRVASDSAPSR